MDGRALQVILGQNTLEKQQGALERLTTGSKNSNECFVAVPRLAPSSDVLSFSFAANEAKRPLIQSGKVRQLTVFTLMDKQLV